MLVGKVKWFSNNKGYGFITTNNSEDVFVHITSIMDSTTLDNGECVEFEIVQTKRGQQARRVKRLKLQQKPTNG